jgi:glutathione synthase
VITRIAVQMDPIDTMVVERDTSLALMVEAQARGFEVWWFTPDALFYDRGAVMARAKRVFVQGVPGAHYETHEETLVELGHFDVVLIRQDPPFDMGYVTNTYLLERAAEETLVLNNPRGVRNIPEKLSTLPFLDLTPPTFVGRDLEAIQAFAKNFQRVVMKPAFLAGGEGVRKADSNDPQLLAIAGELLAESGKEPIIVQAFLEGVFDGDKRVFVLDGEPVGAVRRMPAAGEFRANLHVGGQAVATELDARDREIAARVAPLLREEGILFAGLDVIAGHLTEINVTSPTLIQELKRFNGVDLAALYWDKAEAWFAARQKP